MRPRTVKVRTYTTTKSYSHELSHEEREKMIRGISARHPNWVLKACEYLEKSSQQPDLHKFCTDNCLPYDEFRVFFDLMMTDIKGEIDDDPYLRKICSLPSEEQNEYARLSKHGRDIQLEIAKIYSKIIGEKVELRDFYDEIASKKIDDKLEKALDRKNADHILQMFQVSQLFNVLDEIDHDKEQFLKRHGIE